MNKIIEIYNTFASMVGIPVAVSAGDLLDRTVCWSVITILLVTSIFYDVNMNSISSIVDFILTCMSIFGTILWVVMPPLLGYHYLSFLAKRCDSEGEGGGHE